MQRHRSGAAHRLGVQSCGILVQSVLSFTANSVVAVVSLPMLRPVTDPFLVAALIFGVAILYSAVGQAGGSGYIAVMSLAGLAPEEIRPAALLLNVLVASLATYRYWRAGGIAWPLLWPFLAGSVPLAALGGSLQLPASIYRPVVAVILLLAATQMVRSVWQKSARPDHEHDVAPRPLMIAAGGGIGLLAGLTGTGGGIFLAPLLLWTGWASMRQALGLSAAFILLNSAAALTANLASMRALPATLPLWAAAALAGGLVGTELGGRWLSPALLRLLLSLLLIAAALRLLAG